MTRRSAILVGLVLVGVAFVLRPYEQTGVLSVYMNGQPIVTDYDDPLVIRFAWEPKTDQFADEGTFDGAMRMHRTWTLREDLWIGFMAGAFALALLLVIAVRTKEP